MGKIIFVCDKCKDSYSDFSEQHPKCPACGLALTPTTITRTQWLEMSENEKNGIRNGRQIVAEEAPMVKERILRDLLSTTKSMGKDIHFMYNTLLVCVTLIVLSMIVMIVMLIQIR
ncbi:MAG: hypothetical protein PHY12_04580 [Eubacteriales bacterium]|nr:hypothetical protein [Eubacteriales bacterium]